MIVVVTVDVVTADSKCGVDCGGYSGRGDPGDVGYVSTWRLDVKLCGGGEVRHRGPQGRHGEGEGRVGHAQRGRGEVWP